VVIYAFSLGVELWLSVIIRFDTFGALFLHLWWHIFHLVSLHDTIWIWTSGNLYFMPLFLIPLN